MRSVAGFVSSDKINNSLGTEKGSRTNYFHCEITFFFLIIYQFLFLEDLKRDLLAQKLMTGLEGDIVDNY